VKVEGGAEATKQRGCATTGSRISEHCGVLWVFQERLADDEVRWYLQGSFA
jgi:LDH2 family malate/lactate/ureidoglycolate dehydrogenase